MSTTRFVNSSVKAGIVQLVIDSIIRNFCILNYSHWIFFSSNIPWQSLNISLTSLSFYLTGYSLNLSPQIVKIQFLSGEEYHGIFLETHAHRIWFWTNSRFQRVFFIRHLKHYCCYQFYGHSSNTLYVLYQERFLLSKKDTRITL